MTEKKRHMFETGKKVGIFAHGLFPGGELVQSIGNFQKGVLHTQDLIAEGVKTIYEAAIQYDGVLVLVDLLVKDNGGWKIYEVKSSTGMKDQYLNDAAIQYYVVTKAGLEVDDISIVFINNQYVRSGEIDVKGLFRIESVLEQVIEAQEYIEGTIPELKQVLQLPEAPKIDINERCCDPYECDFTSHCWRHIPEQSIFDLVGLYKPKNFNLYRSGVLGLDQIPDEYPLNDKQRIQVGSYKSQSIHIDRESIQSFLNGLHYPLYFMDFETYSSAIPVYESSRPYQAIPFQYSLHVKENEQAELMHYEFLGVPQEDPRRKFIDSLLRDIGNEGNIIVYNKSFETGILTALLEVLPEYEEVIERTINRIIDLMLPFQKMHYYTTDMRGSYSIKHVLPALVPELDYADLEVSEGIAAMITFEQLLHETDENVTEKTRYNLLEYCKRDTFAMVRIIEVLKSV
jgi:hypothetical protein